MKHYFSSDHHFFHKNILKYCNRPWDSMEEMHEGLIERHNSVVSKGDMVYFLGDFAFTGNKEKLASIFKRLNGQKHIVFGNHDSVKDLKKLPWVWTDKLREIRIEGQKIVLCHYSMSVWNKSHRGSWQLYGHSHGTYPDDPNSLKIDVGVDCHNFTPIEFEEIKTIMNSKEYKPVDGHN